MLKSLRLRVDTASCRCLTGGLQRYAWTPAWLRDAEPDAAASLGLNLSQLMAKAGGAAFNVCLQHYPDHRHWLILVGPGNNGGDGYVMARLAKAAGKTVTVLAMPHNKALPVEAATAKAAWEASGGGEAPLTPDTALPSDVDLVIDGLLGTGMAGAPRDTYADVIARVNALDAVRVAIDVPSGLNAATGERAGACIRADRTVTFICLKPGLLTGAARAVVGQLHYDTLGLTAWMSQPARDATRACRRLGHEDLPVFFGNPRSTIAHKGHNGRVVLIGGDAGYGGAILMASEAALLAGGGLIRAITHPAHVGPLLTRCPEVMVTGASAVDDATSATCAQHIREALEWGDSVAIGPGLGTGRFGALALSLVLAHAAAHPHKSVVLDADALNLLAARDTNSRAVPPPTDGVPAAAVAADGSSRASALPVLPNSIMTPHPGEAARLLGCTVKEIEHDRFAAAQKLAGILGGTCVLKGPGTVVYSASAAGAGDMSEATRCAIIDAGNAGMSVGGMGDVLTGLIAGVAGQRLTSSETSASSSFTTACAGSLAHSVAADVVLAANPERGVRGMRATEVMAHIPICVNACAPPHTTCGL